MLSLRRHVHRACRLVHLWHVHNCLLGGVSRGGSGARTGLVALSESRRERAAAVGRRE